MTAAARFWAVQVWSVDHARWMLWRDQLDETTACEERENAREAGWAAVRVRRQAERVTR